MPQPARRTGDYPIRTATAADAAGVIGVILDAGSMFREAQMAEVSDNPPPAVEDIEAQIRCGHVWVAEHGGHLAGCILIQVIDGHAHIEQVSTARFHQRRGLGRRLVETAENWARAQGHDRVTLTTFTDVAWNAPYYARLGYRILAAGELGQELAAVRAQEAACGLDAWGRCAMARDIRDGPDC